MDYLEPMTAAVRAAANIYRSAKNDLHIEVKGEDKNNLVTAYDKQIQDFLYKELSAAFPGCAFLGEEGGGKIEVPMGLCFIIDPIDGTTNFIRNFEHSAISVGLAVDRKMVAGVVYDVDKDNLYAAQRVGYRGLTYFHALWIPRPELCDRLSLCIFYKRYQ